MSSVTALGKDKPEQFKQAGQPQPLGPNPTCTFPAPPSQSNPEVLMRSSFSGSLLLLLVLICAPGLYAKSNPETLARAATSADGPTAARAIDEIRRLGPSGLAMMRQIYRAQISAQVSNPLLASTPEWQRLSKALDAVSQQKDSYLGGLYWYTDLEQAKAAARVANKPILSLRLLGRLSEEYSCANSRFFRTILYSNAEVSNMLREKFILHWESVRPAPRVTIDFGDGRKLERTLTGNSIHYILDSEGQTVDALPGLHGPGAFLRQLTATENFLRHAGKNNPLPGAFTHYQRDRLNRVNLDWLAEIQKIGGRIPSGIVVLRKEDGRPEALQIASLAVTKAVTETSILKTMTAAPEALGVVTDEGAWRKIARFHLEDSRLDARSIGLIQRQTRESLSDLAGLVEKLEQNIALDTVRNEYLLHTKLYAWLISDQNRSELETLNKKVYAELFLTPATDPWLGLFSPDTYLALEGGGVSR